ncbi:MAG TPA: hypothetical protein PK765_03525 [bacterium]|nr:hypothetical protein [bacterium]
MTTDPNAVVKTNKKVTKDATTQRYLPFSEIRDNLILMKDGSSRMVLRVQAINFNLKSEEEQDAIIFGYQRFLNSLRFPIQIMVRSVKVDIEGYILKLKNLAIKQRNRLLQEQTYQYISFLTNLIDLAQIMRKDFYIVVPYDNSDNQSVRDISFFGFVRNFWTSLSGEESLSSIREKRRSVERLKKHNLERASIIQGSLDSIGLRATLLEKDELFRLFIAYYNPKIHSDPKIRSDMKSINIME